MRQKKLASQQSSSSVQTSTISFGGDSATSFSSIPDSMNPNNSDTNFSSLNIGAEETLSEFKNDSRIFNPNLRKYFFKQRSTSQSKHPKEHYQLVFFIIKRNL